MEIRISVPGASSEEIERGLAAARAVFEEAGISAERAAEASFAIEGWDEAGFPDDDSYPDDEDFAFAHVWGEADEAAAAACCQDWPEEKRVRTADLELDDPEADARRAKMMAEMEAYSRGLTPDLFEKEWKMRPGQPCRSSLTVPLPIRPPLVVAH